MTHDDDFDRRLAQRLRAYEAHIPDGAQPAPETLRSGRRGFVPRLTMVVGAGALAGVLVALVLLNRPTPPIGESSPEPSVSASEAPIKEPPPPKSTASESGWVTIPLDESGRALTATAGPNGIAVIGLRDRETVAWFSPDGRDWRAATVPAGVQDMMPIEMAASELGFVAAMGHCLPESECSDGELWFSADGESWADTPLSITGGLLAHVTAGGPGFVAMTVAPFGGDAGTIPTVLTSPDGFTWTPAEPEGLRGGTVHALGATAGAVVAIGTLSLAEGGTRGATWISSDGLTWTRHDEDSDRAAVSDMAWDGTRLVAVGAGSCPEGVAVGNQCPGEANVAWTSEDGRTWQPAMAAACCGELSIIAATETGWVAVVVPGSRDAPDALAGTSEATEWTEVRTETEGDYLIHDVAFRDGTTVFVGARSIGPDLSEPIIIVSSGSPPSSTDPGTSLSDTIWRVVVSDLVVRDEPGVADPGTILPASLTDEDRVLVVDGPLAVDGYDWYQVLPIRPDGLRERPFGWVASASREGEPWLVTEDLSCPDPSDLNAILALAPEERLACYGGRTIQFRGEQGGCGSAGGLPVSYEPAWLAGSSGCGLGPEPGEISLMLRFPPGASQDFGPGPTVEVTGHFDDPAAATCTGTANYPEATAPSKAEAVALCRTEFVVESLTPVP